MLHIFTLGCQVWINTSPSETNYSYKERHVNLPMTSTAAFHALMALGCILCWIGTSMVYTLETFRAYYCTSQKVPIAMTQIPIW